MQVPWKLETGFCQLGQECLFECKERTRSVAAVSATSLRGVPKAKTDRLENSTVPGEVGRKKKNNNKNPCESMNFSCWKHIFGFQKRRLQCACLRLPNGMQTYVLHIDGGICGGNYFNYLVAWTTT